MIVDSQLHIFDGVARHCGSLYKVSKGDSIKSIKFRLAKLDPKDNWKGSLQYPKGRAVRAAIWLVKSSFSIERNPNYISDNVINTDEFTPQNHATGQFQDCVFTFSTAQEFDVTSVYIGLVSDSDVEGRPMSHLACERTANGQCVLTLDFTSGTSSVAGDLRSQVSLQAYEDNDNIRKPNLTITALTARTLSKRRLSADGKDLPAPDSDAFIISRSSKINGWDSQWNTIHRSHPWADNGGFDILDNYNNHKWGLQDFKLGTDITAGKAYESANKPYWVFDRSRILFKFSNFNEDATSKIWYKIDEQGGSTTSVGFTEVSGLTTSLLICPRDEGIGDNESMTVKLWRCTYDKRGRQLGKSEEIALYFRTFVTPEVHIAYPKNLPNGSNYVLWANEVLNNKFTEDRSASNQICATLNMLLTKDGGDNSGYPVFTRIYIAEYKGEYTSDHKFSSPSNQECLRGTAQRTADWRGIQLDDGKIFQLTGMKNEGFTWDYISDEARQSTHRIATGVDEFSQDSRMYFRAGYKYLIKVRRFHSAAAGAIYAYNKAGGNYDYKMSNEGLTTVYPPAKNANSNNNGYPSNDEEAWIFANNVDVNEIHSDERWVGPADGSSAIDPLSARSDIVYPGFSPADYVVIDCVHAMTSRSNVVSMRPAIQEVGADHWITFGYRHLGKTPSGIDEYDYTGKTNTLNSAGPELDGSISPQIPNKNNEGKFKKYGQTWSGYDNTALRIKLMYKAIVDYAVKYTWSLIPENFKYCPDCGEYLNPHGLIQVEILHQGFQDDGTPRSNTLVYEDDGYSNETVNPNGYKDFLSTDGNTLPSYKEVFYGCSRTGEGATVGTIWGNQYLWFPVVGANDASGNNMNLQASPTVINNTINRLQELGENFASWKVDTSHRLFAPNGYQEAFTVVPGMTGVPDIYKEWYELDGNLYTSKGGTYSNTLSSTNGGVQMFTQKPNNCNQLEPGKLYLRVPPSLDCENGVVNKNRTALPTRIDAEYPVVRTSHFCWFKTHIFGSIAVNVVIESDKHRRGETITNPDGSSSTMCESDGTQEYRNTFYNKDLGNLASIGTGCVNGFQLNGGATYYNILTVYGEDNAGLGRCVSADDSTALYYNFNSHNNKYVGPNASGLNGALELPILVRYTPLVQPIITNNEAIVGTITAATDNTNNEISVIRKGGDYYESNSSPTVSDKAKGKASLDIGISYGMYRSAMAGAYKTIKRIPESEQFNALNEVVETGYTTDGNYNTDIFPSVGICNAFTVILIPNDGKINGQSIDYTKQKPNWFSNRTNYENITSTSDKTAKSVIVYDVAKTDVYHRNLNTENIDHRLNTTLNCIFEYANLFTSKEVKTSLRSVSNRKNLIKENVWYDLVVVPVFTNEEGFGSDSYTDMDFTYTDGAGNDKENKVNLPYGGGSRQTVTYYGSTPLVVRKFLKLHLRSGSGGGGTGGGGSHTPDNLMPIPFETLPCILYPNVNNVRFNVTTQSGYRIKECPGFWLDNTFRVVIRGPHFRSDSEIQRDLSSPREKNYTAALETSLESATNGALSGPEDCKDFVFTDLMVHIGKYDEIPKDRNGNTFDDTPLITIEDTQVQVQATFNSVEYQQLINDHALDKEWLNERGIYSMRNNPEAFSKCTSAQSADNDTRDVITAGALNTSESLEEYCKRLIEFNPHIVNAYADSPEGYYIQVRYLNNEYGGTQIGKWSEWYGGIKDDEAYKVNTTDYNKGMDTDINYCVPVRKYQDIYTGFMSFIKDSYLGSGLQKPETPNGPYKYVPGAGSGSPNSISPWSGTGTPPQDDTWYNGYGNDANTPKIGDTVAGVNLDYDKHFDMLRYWWSPDGTIHFNSKAPAVNANSAYLEINYIDYIIRNMAKLYFANYSECLHGFDSIPYVTFEDIGWTPAKACSYSISVEKYNWPSANDATIDISNTEIQKCLVKTSQPVQKYNNVYDFCPDRYFRKVIGFREYDQLLLVLKHINSLLRDSHITGTNINDIDPKNDEGYGIGIGVLPMSPELLGWIKLNNDTNNNRMAIGHNIEFSTNSNEKPNHLHRTESNYIKQLMQIITSRMTNL